MICGVYAFGRNGARIAAIWGNAGWLARGNKLKLRFRFFFRFMLAAVIKITSKLSLARSPLDIQIILIIYRTRQCQHKFHNLWTTNTHTSSRNHKPIFARANTCFRCTFFLFALLRFCGFWNNKKWSFWGAVFIVLQFNFPWFPGLEFGVFIFVKTIVFTP